MFQVENLVAAKMSSDEHDEKMRDLDEVRYLVSILMKSNHNFTLISARHHISMMLLMFLMMWLRPRYDHLDPPPSKWCNKFRRNKKDIEFLKTFLILVDQNHIFDTFIFSVFFFLEILIGTCS